MTLEPRKDLFTMAKGIWLSPKQVAFSISELIPISEKAIRRYLNQGRLPGVRVAGRWRILSKMVDRLIEKIRPFI